MGSVRRQHRAPATGDPRLDRDLRAMTDRLARLEAELQALKAPKQVQAKKDPDLLPVKLKVGKEFVALDEDDTPGGDDKLLIEDDSAGGVKRAVRLSNLASTATGVGDVVGRASATDGEIAIYDGTTGKLIKASDVTAIAGSIDNVEDIAFQAGHSWDDVGQIDTNGGVVQTGGGNVDTEGGDLDLGTGLIQHTSLSVGEIFEDSTGSGAGPVLHHPAFQARASNQTWDVTVRHLDWDTEDFKEGSAYTHSTSTNPDEITTASAGIYEISVNLSANFNVKGSFQFTLQKDTGSGFADITGTTRYATSSTSGGRESAVLSSWREGMSAGDKFRIRYNRYVAGSGSTVINQSHITIRMVRSI